jgi:hypothetical protein
LKPEQLPAYCRLNLKPEQLPACHWLNLKLKRLFGLPLAEFKAGAALGLCRRLNFKPERL